jgi:hypothetical protein
MTVVDGRNVPTMGGRLECQEALIYYGLKHSGPKVTEESVAKELAEFVDKGGSIYTPLAQAIVAILASGLMGWTPKMEEEEEGKDEAAPAVKEPVVT